MGLGKQILISYSYIYSTTVLLQNLPEDIIVIESKYIWLSLRKNLGLDIPILNEPNGSETVKTWQIERTVFKKCDFSPLIVRIYIQLWFITAKWMYALRSYHMRLG
jgi:hypothetical protein